MSKPSVRIALPSKGVLETNTLNFLAACGLKVSRSNPRQYLAKVKSLPEVEIVFQRVADIPELVESGDVALGVTGYDLFAEHRGYGDDFNEEEERNEQIIILDKDLGYGACKLVMAVPETWIDVRTCADLWHLSGYYQTHKGRGLRIATKYPQLVSRFLRKHQISQCRIFSPHGALEAAPLTDTADLIVDLTETGTTLRENHLKLLEDGIVLQSQSCLIGNAEILRNNAEALRVAEIILELIEAQVQARNGSLLRCLVQGENIEAVQQLCQKINQRLSAISPATFQVLSAEQPEEGHYTLSGVVQVGKSAPELLEIVTVLRSCGASQLTVIPLSYRFAEESTLVRALRERLKRIS